MPLLTLSTSYQRLGHVCQTNLKPQQTAADKRDRALVVDAMAVLQSMKKTLTMRTHADLKETFVKRIENLLNGFNEGRIIFDRYLDQSLKNKTRQNRAATTTEYEIHSEMKLSMPLKELDRTFPCYLLCDRGVRHQYQR